jgi:hypothetical protein
VLAGQYICEAGWAATSFVLPLLQIPVSLLCFFRLIDPLCHPHQMHLHSKPLLPGDRSSRASESRYQSTHQGPLEHLRAIAPGIAKRRSLKEIFTCSNDVAKMDEGSPQIVR